MDFIQFMHRFIACLLYTSRVGERAWFLRSDLWAKVPPAAQFDVVVSNPPYIPSADIETLAADVQREPRLALDGGADGLAAYRRIAEKLADHVKPDGIAAFEVGIGQGLSLIHILKNIRN